MKRPSGKAGKRGTGNGVRGARGSALKRRVPSQGASTVKVAEGAMVMDPAQALALRDLFWGNVARDMLNGFMMLSQNQPQLFDGRFAVLTRGGERIPIAQVFPLFACSVPGRERATSVTVQSTVFRIQTPSGEVFTLPVQEIRAIHGLTPELIERLQRAAQPEDENGSGLDGEKNTDGKGTPFGLAAFAALPKTPEPPKSPPSPEPSE